MITSSGFAEAPPMGFICCECGHGGSTYQHAVGPSQYVICETHHTRTKVCGPRVERGLTIEDHRWLTRFRPVPKYTPDSYNKPPDIEAFYRWWDRLVAAEERVDRLLDIAAGVALDTEAEGFEGEVFEISRSLELAQIHVERVRQEVAQ